MDVHLVFWETHLELLGTDASCVRPVADQHRGVIVRKQLRRHRLQRRLRAAALHGSASRRPDCRCWRSRAWLGFRRPPPLLGPLLLRGLCLRPRRLLPQLWLLLRGLWPRPRLRLQLQWQILPQLWQLLRGLGLRTRLRLLGRLLPHLRLPPRRLLLPHRLLLRYWRLDEVRLQEKKASAESSAARFTPHSAFQQLALPRACQTVQANDASWPQLAVSTPRHICVTPKLR